ncbi:hypothetical protein PV08_04533 [Exophiala spinifera]|uniref:PH domain-containing protein n=1 Tax=Exophiala spinifera TaxID=91928 RepID=A0A0D1YQ30_9EURO|nr:uncharacterized protein PV08_04533 [Exophiala spinifera]KIW17341.1 hypothetical protein PV08_04533 [Exophiala spinifera]
MATAVMAGPDEGLHSSLHASVRDMSDPFVDDDNPRQSSHSHRYSSLVDPDSITLGAATSPSQVKRSIIAHLAETERRLHDAQKLGESLLLQQSELNDKLREVEEHQEDAEISPELRKQLADLEREHNDVGKEIARALLGPKSRAVSGEEKLGVEQSTFTSQATASPTKVTAPSRRQRNQPSNRAGDLQFAADISTSLLAQVRSLQSAVAERDDLLKQANADRDRLEQEAQLYVQRLRAQDESEQKYKDENWNLETQTHELLAAAREAADREKRLNTSLAAAVAEKSRLQSEMDEIRVAHEKLTDEHTTAKKAYDSELHTLKRGMDVGEGERAALQNKVDELTAQNHELARAVAARLRGQHPDAEASAGRAYDEEFQDLESPEHSPPASPTKATPRHGGLESETLRSSLHHAHRMIQNLKNNIHREKTEKIELKRMLQDARDELEQRRGDVSLGSGNKRQKTKSDTFKKPARPDMLGGSRRARTDIELEDDDWEDNTVDSPTKSHTQGQLAVPVAAGSHTTDLSDAYQTANETEGAFETADERHATESEDFQTGAESLAGDSTDDLTETEDTAAQLRRKGISRTNRPSLAFKPAGDRQSYMSTASTSAGEDEDELKTPVLSQPQKFRLKNGRTSFARQSRVPPDGTPTTVYSESAQQDSPATIGSERSVPGAERSLFAELGGMDDSSNFGTPGRASIASAASTPGVPAYTPSKQPAPQPEPVSLVKAAMVDCATMTDPWKPDQAWPTSIVEFDDVDGSHTPFHEQSLSPIASQFPLPPTVPVSPIKNIDNGTQYTPQRTLQESPIRNTAFITPPKTVWDEAQSPQQGEPVAELMPQPLALERLNYSGLLMLDTMPVTPEKATAIAASLPEPLTLSSIYAQVTEPVRTPQKKRAPGVTASTQVEDSPSRPHTTEKVAASGLLASAAAALGLSKAKNDRAPLIAEDETSEQTGTASEMPANMPLRDVSGNSIPVKHVLAGKSDYVQEQPESPSTISQDQGSQTLLTAQQIEEALRTQLTLPLPLPEGQKQVESVTSPLGPVTPAEALDRQEVDIPGEIVPGIPIGQAIPLPSPTKRPSSSMSRRLSNSHPPLPPDHKAAIAKAASRVSSPTRELNAAPHVPTVMGPPALPASAMRRPRTPGDSVRSPSRDGTAHRTSNVGRHQRGTVTSQLSHRSSVSSFASELDERFNIHPAGQMSAHGFGTDPRIIQAITQTMIGEFLWKYTRKAGRAEMSETRHRRYFWVHPYTKTLYWSDQDPQTAGRNELKAKSVLIESVKVIPDDNPMPPGLHRKSLEIITPGRRVRFTASTGQRHETWFNALNYLLLRGDDASGGTYQAGGSEITRDDVDEFNVNAGGYGATLVPTTSRMSLSSYNSRTTRGTSANRASTTQRPALGIATTGATRPSHGPTNDTTTRQSRVEQSQETNTERAGRASSVSRFSRMIGSVTGKTRGISEAANRVSGARSEAGSIYDASLVSDGRKDSAEELRREMLRQEQVGFGGLENVRACCDGMYRTVNF